MDRVTREAVNVTTQFLNSNNEIDKNCFAITSALGLRQKNTCFYLWMKRNFHKGYIFSLLWWNEIISWWCVFSTSSIKKQILCVETHSNRSVIHAVRGLRFKRSCWSNGERRVCFGVKPKLDYPWMLRTTIASLFSGNKGDAAVEKRLKLVTCSTIRQKKNLNIRPTNRHWSSIWPTCETNGQYRQNIFVIKLP